MTAPRSQSDLRTAARTQEEQGRPRPLATLPFRVLRAGGSVELEYEETISVPLGALKRIPFRLRSTDRIATPILKLIELYRDLEGEANILVRDLEEERRARRELEGELATLRAKVAEMTRRGKGAS